MTLTYAELMEKLKQLDEITLLELLEIDSEQLVDSFEYIIENNYDKILKAVED